MKERSDFSIRNSLFTILPAACCCLLAVLCMPLSAQDMFAPVEWRPATKLRSTNCEVRNPQFTVRSPQFSTPLAESTHSFDVRHYRIDLSLPMDSGAAQAHERILFTSRVSRLDSIVLMMDSLTCDSVKHGAERLSFAFPPDSLVIALDSPPAEGESLALDIFYHRNSGTPNRGFFYYPHSYPRHTLAFSCAAPYDARFWFPCYDEPYDKAEQGCAINVTVPDSLSVCSNGMLDSVVADTARHTATWFWTHRFPISTYLMVFAVSKWVKYVQHCGSNQPDSIEVWSYCCPEDTTNVHTNLRNVPDMFQFFADTARFGRYPFERYGHVYCTGFQYGGMENQTMTMLALGQVNDATISHEMSHMWWGDMVTCVDYRNIWLNEGFANYWEAQYTEHQSGHARFLTTMKDYATSYFNEDAQHRFATYDPGIENVYAYGTIYCKGAWLQHMLRYVEGDTVFLQPGVFYRALRVYGDSFKYGCASSQDYQRIQEHCSGLDLGWFYNEWLYQAGYPQYRLAWSAESTPCGIADERRKDAERTQKGRRGDVASAFCERGDSATSASAAILRPSQSAVRTSGFRVIVNLSQSNGNNAPPVFHMPVQLKFWGHDPNRLGSGSCPLTSPLTALDTLVVMPVETTPQIDTFALSFRPDSISFDPGKWILNKATVTGVDERFIQRPDPELQIAGPALVRDAAQFRCSAPARAQLAVYDAVGRETNRYDLNPGITRIAWNCSALPTGVYLARLSTDTESATRKLIVAR